MDNRGEQFFHQPNTLRKMTPERYASQIATIENPLREIPKGTVTYNSVPVTDIFLCDEDGERINASSQTFAPAVDVILQFGDEDIYVFSDKAALEKELETYRRKYRALVIRGAALDYREIRLEDKSRLTQDLDEQKAAIHTRASEAITLALEIGDDVTTTSDSTTGKNEVGRKLFETYCNMQDALDPHTILYQDTEFQGIDPKELRAHVLREAGIEIDITSYGSGFHNQRERYQYLISATGATDAEMEKINSIIARMRSKK